MKDRILLSIGILILLVQVAMIVRARFVEDRYYCWAPHDSQNEYVLQVRIDGRSLEPSEIKARYRIEADGTDPRAIQHVKDTVSQYEETYGRGDDAVVSMTYRTNGGPEQAWAWPQP